MRRRSTALLALLAFLAASCSVERGGRLRVGPPPDGGSVDAGPGTDGPAPDLGGSDLGGADLGVDLGLPRCDPFACPGLFCDPLSGSCGHHPSCRALAVDDRVAPLTSDLYEIDVDGAGPRAPLQVYCDMSIAGGGWTLVGRTEGNSDQAFGWTTPFGAVDDDRDPYSLGLGAALAFTEVLVGKRGGGKNWGDRVYRFTVPAGFVTTYAASAYAITDLTAERGTCMPVGGPPSMLRHAGFTETADHFFFRDLPGIDVYGMRADGFSMNYNDCVNGGDLQSSEGMIMVR